MCEQDPRLPMRTFLYRTVTHPSGASTSPDFEIVDRLVYRTASHPDGSSAVPVYEVVCGRLYRTAGHPEGACRFGDYAIIDDALCRTTYHRCGPSRLPDYEIRHAFVLNQVYGLPLEVAFDAHSLIGRLCCAHIHEALA